LCCCFCLSLRFRSCLVLCYSLALASNSQCSRDPALIIAQICSVQSPTIPLFVFVQPDPIGIQSKKSAHASRAPAQRASGLERYVCSRVSPQRRARLGSSGACLPQAGPAHVCWPKLISKKKLDRCPFVGAGPQTLSVL
jgi:hypothetical protein